MKQILKVLKFLSIVKDKKVIIFGTGSVSKIISEMLPFKIDYFVDNDPSKWNKTFLSSKVYAVPVLAQEEKNDVFILILSSYYKEICKQLNDMDFAENIHFFDGLDLFGEVLHSTSPNCGYWQGIYQDYRNVYEVSPSFLFNGEGILLYGTGRIVLGENSYIGRYSSIQAHENCTVRIGENCQISHFVKIYTCNALADQDFSKLPMKLVMGDVRIGNYCWIGASVFIREGVSIGDNVAIGANSVVITDIPDNTIVGGVPAKILKYKTL